MGQGAQHECVEEVLRVVVCLGAHGSVQNAVVNLVPDGTKAVGDLRPRLRGSGNSSIMGELLRNELLLGDSRFLLLDLLPMHGRFLFHHPTQERLPLRQF